MTMNAIVMFAIAAAATAAGVPAAEAAPRLELSLLGGRTFYDPTLADFQWDVSSRPTWGGRVMARQGRAGLGLRVLRSSTDQRTGLTAPEATSVTRTSADVVARFSAARVLNTDAWVGGSAGWMHLGYSPDSAVIPLSSGDVTVQFDPINEATFSFGAGLNREIAPRWAIGMSVERELFRLNTAHRRGDDVIEAREGFGTWNARLEMTWVVHPG